MVKTLKKIEPWLIYYFSNLLDIDANEIDTNVNFIDYGLDSASIVVITNDIATWLDRKLDSRLLYDYPTIALLSEHLNTFNLSRNNGN